MGRIAHVRTPVKFPRLTLINAALVASAALVATQSHAITNVAPTGLPLYQFAETGTGPLPWNAASLKAKLNSTTMLGGPHGATNATQGVLAYRTNDNDLALYVQTTTGATAWRDYTTGNDMPTPADDPIPFFDPSGNVDLLYVDTTGHVDSRYSQRTRYSAVGSPALRHRVEQVRRDRLECAHRRQRVSGAAERASRGRRRHSGVSHLEQSDGSSRAVVGNRRPCSHLRPSVDNRELSGPGDVSR